MSYKYDVNIYLFNIGMYNFNYNQEANRNIEASYAIFTLFC